MKIQLLFIGIMLGAKMVPAQGKIFEGIITYHNEAKSKNKVYPDSYYNKFYQGNSDSLVVYIKNGNYKRVQGYSVEYYLASDKRVYTKYRNLDTLYYLDYNFDSTKPFQIMKSDGPYTVDNFQCKSITLKFKSRVSQYFYTNQYRENTKYDEDNTIGNYNFYMRETNGAVWLMNRVDHTVFYLADSCVRLEEKKLDDSIFKFPDLPLKKMDFHKALTPVKFRGGVDDWHAYLDSSVNKNLGNQYVPIPDNQDTASSTVMVLFFITEEGKVADVKVENPEKVNPRLAEEAIRIISNASGWAPAKIHGENIMYAIKQPIIFLAQRSN